jgi:nitroreductase
MSSARYSDTEIAAIERVIRERVTCATSCPTRCPMAYWSDWWKPPILRPPVGFMQPWRFLRITDRTLRNSKIATVQKRACGYRNPNHFKIAVYFHCGGLNLYPAAVTHTKVG